MLSWSNPTGIERSQFRLDGFAECHLLKLLFITLARLLMQGNLTVLRSKLFWGNVFQKVS